MTCNAKHVAGSSGSAASDEEKIVMKDASASKKMTEIHKK
jgi:hypothetical protein